MSRLVITGASGFLGGALVAAAGRHRQQEQLIALPSPRAGGIDLAQDGAVERLGTVTIEDPQDSVLIHAAAAVDWHGRRGLTDNAAMAWHVGRWAQAQGFGFCVLVSGVNVYPDVPWADLSTPPAPTSAYGAGKLVAEQLWSALLPSARWAIVRLAGLWGWQRRPTLFWNRVLVAAAHGQTDGEPLVVQRAASRRNYLAVDDAADCVVQVGLRRMSGLWLAAGVDTVTTQTFVQAVERLPGARLRVQWDDGGGADERLYEPSQSLRPWLRPFHESLDAIWQEQPEWLMQPA